MARMRSWSESNFGRFDLDFGNIFFLVRGEGRLTRVQSYADWVQLNEPHLMAIRRGFLTPLDLSTYAEAIGDLMDLRVVVDPSPDAADAAYAELLARTSATRPPVKLPRLTTPLPTSDLLPPIHFHGTSAQQGASITLPSEGPLSFVRGVVRLTADDPPEIRWTIVIRYSGEDRWRLEGVQVGGRCSRRGFFGVSETACFLFTCYLVAFLACCVLCSYRYGRPSMSHRDLLCPLPCSLDTWEH